MDLLEETRMKKRAATAQQISTTIQARDEFYNVELRTFPGGEEFDTSLLDVRSQLQN